MSSILNGKCPRCNKGEVFCSKNPYDFKSMFLVHNHCSNCGAKFNPEPGFFYGAMYVGYAISVAYLTSFYVAMKVLLGEFDLSIYFLLAIGSLVLATPFVFRISRAIWLAFFVKDNNDEVLKWQDEMKGKKDDNPCEEA